MACNNCSDDTKVYLADGDGISFTGAGTKTSPFTPHLAEEAGQLQLEVRDSPTVNFTLFGTGLPGDPLVLSADTSSAAKLANLADVAAAPAPVQGRVPMWIGSPSAGRFEFRNPGTRYTTHANRGDGLYQGEQILETDTGERFEWDGSQYLSLVPTSVAPSALDPSVLQNKGTIDGNTNWNTLVNASGIYRVQAGINSNNGSPNGAYGYGTLEVVKSGNSVTQRYSTHSYSRTFVRTKWNDADWTGWTFSATMDDLNNEALARAGSVNNLQGGINNEINARNDAINNVYGNYDNGRLDSRYLRPTWEDVTSHYRTAPGWSAQRLVVRRFAGIMLIVDADLQRTGGTIGGNFANQPMINADGGWGSGWYQGLESGPSNWPHANYVQGPTIYLASFPAQMNVDNGDLVSVAGMWFQS